MRRFTVATMVALALITTGCTHPAGDGDGDAGTPSVDSTTADQSAADADLILTMYADINQAFQINPDDGVRAIISSQYPGDLADVDFKRCVNAILPGATTLPATKKLHFVPNIATLTPDPAYILTSDKVKGLQPEGRIYVADIEMNDGGTPTVRQRHQVILNGVAYQFSKC